MSTQGVDNRLPPNRRRFQPNIYWLAYTAWICCACLPVVLEMQHDRDVQHFAPLPFLFLFLMMMCCVIICLFWSLWRIVRGPHRRSGVVLSAVALVPIVFWTTVGIYAYTCWNRLQKPNTFLMNVARRSAASVMGAELYVRYPRRIERRRFMMFYQNIASPDRDADKMDAYINELEQRYHRSVRVPIYWVRGSLLGQSNMSDNGLALGSANSGQDAIRVGGFDGLDGLDRHEVAHAVMHQWQTPESDPPTFIEEGWAESNGDLHMHIASAAAELIHLENVKQVPRRGTMLVSLLSTDSYYRDEGAVYPCGAFITIYLIEKYGFDKYLKLYNSIRPQTAIKDMERVFGTDMITLEMRMWQEADRLSAADH